MANASRSMSAKVRSNTFWSRLQPRERMLVMLLVATFFVMATFILFFFRSQKLRGLDDEIVDMKAALELVETRGPNYQEKLKAKANREAEIADTPLLFGTIIEQAEAVSEVSASNQQEKPTLEIAEGLRQRSIEFDLRNVTLEQLTKFISSVESQDGRVVLTQRLLVRSPSENEDRLNVEVELATWERVVDETVTTEEPAVP